MKPYYDEDGITIYHADCREVLPNLSADAVLTDPPYGNNTPYASYDDSPESLVALADETFPMMSAVAPIVAITSGVANIHKWPPPKWTLCWFNPAGHGSGPWGFCTWQPVLVYGPDPYLAQGLGRRPDGLMQNYTPQIEDRIDNDHPVAKPLSISRWLVERLAPQQGVFVDPFMGGGGFLSAMRQLGHKAIGIEIEERYCEIAVERLAQGVFSFDSG